MFQGYQSQQVHITNNNACLESFGHLTLDLPIEEKGIEDKDSLQGMYAYVYWYSDRVIVTWRQLRIEKWIDSNSNTMNQTLDGISYFMLVIWIMDYVIRCDN